MTIPILQTKLYIPSPLPKLVPRARLVDWLSEGRYRKLTLLAAQAGAGKTTLVSHWLNQLDEDVAWLSLDEADREPSRFWLYVIAALQSVHPTLGRAAQSVLEAASEPSFEILLTGLINEIAASPGRIILVFDDYHFISAAAIHQTLSFLLDHLPPQLHLVILTREDPPLPLARLRVGQQITEIRTDDLRFDSNEAHEFLHQTMGMTLQLDEVAVLAQRTEGWAAGLQMAALSMQHAPDVASFVKTFAGDDLYIVEYLIVEVLERQPVQVQTFLLQTSILKRFTASLCDAVTERGDGWKTLLTLEHAGLFLVALDHQRAWFRYHHLFADLLAYRLRQQVSAAEIQELHRRAAAWYAQNDLIDEVLHHNLAATDFDQAAELVESNILGMMRQGQLRKLRQWLEMLPESIIQLRPLLGVYDAWSLLLMGKFEAMMLRLQQVERGLEEKVAPSTRLGKEVRAHVAAMHAYVARRQGKIDEALGLLRQALDDLPEDNYIIQNVVRYNLGFTHLLAGQIETAIPFLRQARRDALVLNNVYTAIAAASELATAYVMQGRLTNAATLYEEEITAGLDRNHDQPFPLAGFAYAGLGQILYEHNDLQAAEESIALAIKLGDSLSEAGIVFEALVPMGWLKTTQGDDVAALALWKRAASVAQQMGDQTRAAYVAAYQARAWLWMSVNPEHSSALGQAVQWAKMQQDEPREVMDYQECFIQLTLAWVELAQNRVEQALSRLTSLAEMAKTRGWIHNLIKIYGLQALAHDARCDLDAALDTLQRAFNLAVPEGYIRTFVDYGPPMQALLRRAADSGIVPDYIAKLLSAFPRTSSTADTSPWQSQAVNPKSEIVNLVEPLNEREDQILRMMTVRLSNQQIADELHLSINTVKWYARHIYGKLGVANRVEAVDCARQLGIV